ncbi:MAG: ATP-dependent helicase [Acidobacteriota bacterium]
MGGAAPAGGDTPDYDTTCRVAGTVLAAPDVVKWVSSRFPVLVLDEFQDCAQVRLEIAQRLHGHVEMLIAADDFQSLTRSVESPGVAWLRELGVSEELTVNHRTADSDLIAAAHALRSGVDVPTPTSASFRLINVPAADVAASFISQTIAPAAGRDIVILSAARPGTSPWVDRTLELVGTKQYGRQKSGPVAIRWEVSPEAMAEDTKGSLGIGTGNPEIEAAFIYEMPAGLVSKQLKRWAEQQRRLLGKTLFDAQEVGAQVDRAIQHIRSAGFVPQFGRLAMTIHQAKNREFPVVIVLWPFKVVTDPILARRWLYNAITRAKRRALVIVEDPKETRLTSPPFAYPPSQM